QYSRRSFTAHYIPESHRFLQFQSEINALKLRSINGMNVHHPKDLGSFSNRVILAIETTVPKSFQFAKRLGLKVVTSLSAGRAKTAERSCAQPDHDSS
ncbi:MAG TPA: hypothetical protein VNY06_07635, partial [Methylocella sp.]|nr:hypothetical protein [Methylocella sp.]